MSKFKMNCGYCGRKCNMETDFCIPQDSVYICKKCYEWQDKVSKLEDKLLRSNNVIDEINKEFLDTIKNWKQLVEIEKEEKKKLKQQLALTEKALELACNELNDLKKELWENDHIAPYDFTAIKEIECFKEEAKEIMESE